MDILSKKFLLFFIGICCVISLNAQNKITGKIIDENKQGLDGVVIMLVSQPDNILVETTLTDSNGIFNLPLRKGDFLLCVRMLGYKEVKQSIRITDISPVYDIQLEPDQTTLQNVVVTARKSRPMTSSSNGKIHIYVSQSYLSDIGSAFDVLKHSPGISVNNKGDISLATLGGTAIYINGRKLMLQGDELSSYLRSLSSSKISRIETSPSPNASFGADGAGGIINIILKTSDKSGFYLNTSNSVSYWKNLKQNSDLSVSYNTNEWQLGFNYNHSIGYYSMNYGYDKTQNGDRSLSKTIDTDKRNTYFVGCDFSWQPNNRSKLFFNSTINILAGPGETQTTTYVYKGQSLLEGILKANNNYIEQTNIRYNNSINYIYQLSDKQQLSVSGDWTHFDGKARCEQPNNYYSSSNNNVRSDAFLSLIHI